MNSVIIDGVRYVPDPEQVDGVRFYYMHDNQCFTRLYGVTLDEILSRADEVEAESPHGMLCPVLLLQGKKTIRRVGKAAHAKGSKDPKDYWNAGKAAWRESVEADADVMRLLASNAK